MTSRPIEGQYPNWRALVPKRPASNALTVGRDELMGAIKRAALVADQGIISVSYHDGGVSISARSPEHGEASEEVHTCYCGHAFKSGFQAGYLLDMLSALDGDVVFIQQDGPTAAASIVDPAAQQSRAYVMPVRLP